MVDTAIGNAAEQLSKLGLLSPLNESAEADKKWQAAPPVPDLQGKRVGFLSNTWGGQRQIMVYERLRDRFLERFELGHTVIVAKEVHSRPAAQEIIEALVQQCDAVITGVGG
jgi:hypothetical protein